MPAPGDQHMNQGGETIANPFEEIKPRVSEYTAREIVTLQSRLEKQLGPEYISSRTGPSGQKVHYLAAEKCIQLANEVFGFNGWSSQIINIQVDFVDENATTMKVSLGLSVVVRVTLRNGTFHEDIGYGHIENCKGKAAAFEKAKKEGTTDGLKRALRNFGNVLGNCIYDKEYLSKVTKVKVAPTKWDVNNLHRHSTYAAVPPKKDNEALAHQDSKQAGATEATSPDTLDDEFGDFDDADFAVSHDPDSHPDEVVLPVAVISHHLGSGQLNIDSMATAGANQIPGPPHQHTTGANRTQIMSAPIKSLAAAQRPEDITPRIGPPALQQQNQPQTPNTGFLRSSSGSGQVTSRAQQSANPPIAGRQNAAPGIGRVLNQPNRTATHSAPTSPVKQQKPFLSNEDVLGLGLPPNLGPNGFFSARAAQVIVESGDNQGVPPPRARNLPAFNPNAESPSIRKTPGVDHSKTRPTTRELKHVPGPSDPEIDEAPTMRANIINPQLNATRRIGAPGSASPLSTKGAYKPPTMKRPNDGVAGMRPPLGNIPVPANGAQASVDSGNDLKRQRLNGPS